MHRIADDAECGADTRSEHEPLSETRPQGILATAGAPVQVARHGRSLGDWILVAVHRACDENDLEAASLLLAALEDLLARRYGSMDRRRRTLAGLVAAHERLWYLRRANPPERGDLPLGSDNQPPSANF
jgi:hypothetical protein